MNPAKLHKSLSVTMSAEPDEDEAMPVILKLRRGAVARGEMTALNDVPNVGSYRLLAAQATRATPRMIAALTEDPAVELIWPDLPVHTWLDDAVPRVGAPRVWDSGFTGRGVRIAILDTGLDGDHPDFDGRVAAWKDFVDRQPEGQAGDGSDGEAGADRPIDPNGHGTHVAGIAAGDGSASGGRYVGVARGADLVIGRVLDAAGGGRTSTVMAGIEWAIEAGARIINISLGGPPYPADGDDALSLMCNAAVAEGIVVCVAAGNLGPAGHTIGAPAAARSVVTVGASEMRDGAHDVVAPFSSRGPTGDGRTKPDLLFPGVAIAAPRATGTRLGQPIDDRYTSLRGTSQSAPIAAGAAALLLEANARLQPEEIKERLLRGARPLPDSPEVAQGRGIGDVYNAFVGRAGTPTVLNPPADAARPGDELDGAERSGCLPGGGVAGAFRRR